MAANEQAQVAVPMKVSTTEQEDATAAPQPDEVKAKCEQDDEQACRETESEAKSVESEPPATPEKIMADRSVSVETPPGLQAVTCLELPAGPTGALPPLKGAPPRLEPIAVTPDKASIQGVIQDSPSAKSPAVLSISNHPNVPPSPATSAV